jgi:hypothetical protein
LIEENAVLNLPIQRENVFTERKFNMYVTLVFGTEQCPVEQEKFTGLECVNMELSHFNISWLRKQGMAWSSSAMKTCVFVQPAHSDLPPFPLCVILLNMQVLFRTETRTAEIHVKSDREDSTPQ